MTYQHNIFILQYTILEQHNKQTHDTQYKFTAHNKRGHHTPFNTQSGPVHLSCPPEYRRLSVLLTGEQPVRTGKGLSRVIYYTWAAAGGCEMFLRTVNCSRLHLKCDGTRAETRFRLSAKRTSPFKSAGASGQSTPGSRGVRISGNSVGYTMFRGSVKSTGYPLHSPVSPSLPLPCVTMYHHISTGLYFLQIALSSTGYSRGAGGTG
jgi:hypothetical protein